MKAKTRHRKSFKWRKRADSSPVRRAMENLRAVLRQRLREDVAKKVLHEVASILDEAAQRIERL